MSWIRTVPPEQAEDRLRSLYEGARKRAGKIFNVVRIQSLDPRIMQAGMGLYQAAVLEERSPLPRWFRELIAVEVSKINGCVY
jgi:alkylhydroperoxidase family enzyme